MKYVFRYKKWDRYYLYFIAIFVGLITLIIAANILPKNDTPTSDKYFIFFMLLGIVLLLVLVARNAYIWTVTLHEEGITRKNIFGTRTLHWEAIKGFRVLMPNYIVIEPTDARLKNLNIKKEIEGGAQLINLLGQRYSDLNLVEQGNETDLFLENEAFGASFEERVAYLKKWEQNANRLNLIAGVLSLWVFLVPHPSLLEVWSLVLMPFVFMLIVWFSKGAIRLLAGPNSRMPNLGIGLLFLSLLFLASALIKHNLLDFMALLKPVLTLAAIYGALLLYSTRNTWFTPERTSRLLVIGLISLWYALGAVIWLNCQMDRGQPFIQKAVVLKKNTSTSAFVFQNYTIEIQDWEIPEETLPIEINREFYEKTSPQDTVLLEIKKGWLGARWVKSWEAQ